MRNRDRSEVCTRGRGASRRGMTAESIARYAAQDAKDAEVYAANAAKLATAAGYCVNCGEVVDEAAGKLHHPSCPGLPPERRRPE